MVVAFQPANLVQLARSLCRKEVDNCRVIPTTYDVFVTFTKLFSASRPSCSAMGDTCAAGGFDARCGTRISHLPQSWRHSRPTVNTLDMMQRSISLPSMQHP